MPIILEDWFEIYLDDDILTCNVNNSHVMPIKLLFCFSGDNLLWCFYMLFYSYHLWFLFFSQDKDKVSKFVSWATLTALQSNIEKVHGLENFDCIMRLQSEEESDDSLISKLVRWLTASVIVGKCSLKFSNLDICHSFDRSKFNNLLFSMMEWNEQKLNSSSRTFACDETLASSIFFLQQLQRTNYTVLPSVVSALCLLSSSLSSAGTRNIISTAFCTQDNLLSFKLMANFFIMVLAAW